MISCRPTNGVSYGLKHTVTAAEETAGEVDFDFRISTTDLRYDIVASVQILNASGVLTMPADLAITYPSQGVVKVAGTLVENTVINLVAQAANPTIV